MKITLLTASSPKFWPLMEVVYPNRAIYCLRHGYQLIVRNFCADQLTLKQERFAYIIEALNTCDWLLYIDCDAVITNDNVKVEDIIAKYPGMEMIVCNDINGFNSGIMLLKSTKTIKRLFGETNKRLHKNPAENDQVIMSNISHEWYPEIRAAIVHQRVLNSMPYWIYPQYTHLDTTGGAWKPGDFILHIPGLDVAGRQEIMIMAVTGKYNEMMELKAQMPPSSQDPPVDILKKEGL